MNEYDASIMVTGTGGGVGQSIIKAIRLANKELDRNYRIISADMDENSPGLYRGDKGVLVPPATSDDYIESLIEACNEHDIDLLLPGSDPELPVIADNKEKIEAEGTRVVISEPDGLEIGMDKWKLQEFLRLEGFQNIPSCLPEKREEFLNRFDFPLIVKPRVGSSAKGVEEVKDREELEFYLERIDKPVIQEKISSSENEFTVGVLVSDAGEVIDSIALRRRLKNGSTYRAKIDEYPKVEKKAEEVVAASGLIGSINVQLRITDEGPVPFEINPRFSGTTTVRAFAGYNGVDAVIRNFVYDEEIGELEYESLIMMRYLNEIYLPPEKLENVSKDGSIDLSGDVFSEF